MQTWSFVLLFKFSAGWQFCAPKPARTQSPKTYSAEESYQNTAAKVRLHPDTSIKAQVQLNSDGWQYANHSRHQHYSQDELLKKYKREYDMITDPLITGINHKNDKNKIDYQETMSISAVKVGAKMQDLWLFKPLLFNESYIPQRTEVRLTDIEIDRGYTDKDEYEFELQPGVQVKELFAAQSLTSEFGDYTIKAEKTDKGFKLTRVLTIKKGLFNKEKYDQYMDFKTQVYNHDQSKVLLTVN